MWCSRRSKLARATDRRPPQAPPGFLTRLATTVLLLAGGVVLSMFAVRLAAAAFRWDFSPFAYLPLAADHGLRALWLLAAVAALGFLVWLVDRHERPTLWLAGPEGGVAVPASPLEELAVRAAEADDEVVRAKAELHVSRGVLKADVRVLGRPLGDAARLGGDAEARVRAGLVSATGIEDVRVKVRPRILAVRQLARHLP
jgi:hypothetical protein